MSSPILIALLHVGHSNAFTRSTLVTNFTNSINLTNLTNITNTINCGHSCNDFYDCGILPGPCGTCREGTCRAPSAPVPLLVQNASNDHCLAQYCYEDSQCAQWACPKCGPPLPVPKAYSICISDPQLKKPAKKINQFKIHKTPDRGPFNTTKLTSKDCAARYCTSTEDCDGWGDCSICSPPVVPGGPRVCIPPPTQNF